MCNTISMNVVSYESLKKRELLPLEEKINISVKKCTFGDGRFIPISYTLRGRYSMYMSREGKYLISSEPYTDSGYGECYMGDLKYFLKEVVGDQSSSYFQFTDAGKQLYDIFNLEYHSPLTRTKSLIALADKLFKKQATL